MPTIITVSGTAELKRAPERATARLAVGFEGPVRERVVEQSTALHRSLTEQINGLLAAASSVTAAILSMCCNTA